MINKKKKRKNYYNTKVVSLTLTLKTSVSKEEPNLIDARKRERYCATLRAKMQRRQINLPPVPLLPSKSRKWIIDLAMITCARARETLSQPALLESSNFLAGEDKLVLQRYIWGSPRLLMSKSHHLRLRRRDNATVFFKVPPNFHGCLPGKLLCVRCRS